VVSVLFHAAGACVLWSCVCCMLVLCAWLAPWWLLALWVPGGCSRFRFLLCCAARAPCLPCSTCRHGQSSMGCTHGLNPAQDGSSGGGAKHVDVELFNDDYADLVEQSSVKDRRMALCCANDWLVEQCCANDRLREQCCASEGGPPAHALIAPSDHEPACIHKASLSHLVAREAGVRIGTLQTFLLAVWHVACCESHMVACSGALRCTQGIEFN
jgi:hypothetical protein